jgi:hypothetical protein
MSMTPVALVDLIKVIGSADGTVRSNAELTLEKDWMAQPAVLFPNLCGILLDGQTPSLVSFKSSCRS